MQHHGRRFKRATHWSGDLRTISSKHGVHSCASKVFWFFSFVISPPLLYFGCNQQLCSCDYQRLFAAKLDLSVSLSIVNRSVIDDVKKFGFKSNDIDNQDCHLVSEPCCKDSRTLVPSASLAFTKILNHLHCRRSSQRLWVHGVQTCLKASKTSTQSCAWTNEKQNRGFGERPIKNPSTSFCCSWILSFLEEFVIYNLSQKIWMCQKWWNIPKCGAVGQRIKKLIYVVVYVRRHLNSERQTRALSRFEDKDF